MEGGTFEYPAEVVYRRVEERRKADAELIALREEVQRLREEVARFSAKPQPLCAKCRGSGQFEFVRGSWGDCPACDGRGH